MKKRYALSICFPIIIWTLIPDGRYDIWFIITHMIVLPLISVFLNCICALKPLKSYFYLMLCSLFGLFFGNVIGYLRWGLSSGKLLNPDGETIWIAQHLLAYQLCFVIIGTGIGATIMTILFRIKKSKEL
jgi:hypothetical protein